MKKLSIIIIATVVFLAGCSGESAGYNVKQEDYVQRTLVDGITYNIPESWKNLELESNKYGEGYAYFVETDGDVEKKGTFGMSGWNTDNVHEGFQIEYVVAYNMDVYQGMSSAEMVDYFVKSFKEMMATSEESDYEMDTLTINGYSVFKSVNDEKETMYGIMIGNGKMIYCTVYSDPNKTTKHSAEFKNVLESVTIDETMLK